MPNMDEVVRQVKEEFDEITEGEWVSDGFGTIIIAHSGRIIASVYAPEDFKIVANGPEWLRLLIEEREQKDAEIEQMKEELASWQKEVGYRDAEIKRQIDNGLEKRRLIVKQEKQLAEQDKDIQRLNGLIKAANDEHEQTLMATADYDPYL